MTLICNLFAGPGVGKSTSAAGLFYKLKSNKINSEYIQEYAKDKTWEESIFALQCQPYITSKQLYRQYRIMDKVDVAVTDSPIVLGIVYGGKFVDAHFNEWVVNTFNQFNNLNIFLKRNVDFHGYQEAGRNQTLDEAEIIDLKIREILHKYGIPYTEITIEEGYIEKIYDMISLRI